MPVNRIRAENAAISLLEKYGYTRPGDLVLEDLAFALGIRVRTRPMDNIEGRLLRVGSLGIIQVNSRADPNRQRFSIAHEIGHWELHPTIQQKFCTASDMLDYLRSPEEVEANHFAASLLLPKKWIPKNVLNEDPGFNQVESLANCLGASFTCSARRYVELTSQPVVLVSSSKGQVDWSVCSEKTQNFWIGRGLPIHRFTTTYECVNKNDERRDLEETEGQFWYPKKDLNNDFEIFEEAWNNRKYGYCLTLLWLTSLF